MNRMMKTTLASVLALSLAAGFGLTVSAEEASNPLAGAAAAAADSTYSLEDMLTYAIEDEYLARAEYEAIQDEFGQQRIFSNIARAEERHIAAILPLFAAHGLTTPADPSAGHEVLPDGLAEAYKIGVEAEIRNIDMYKQFLAQENLPDDVRTVFEHLMRASEQHLKAYERAVERTESGLPVGSSQGAGQGNRAGRQQKAGNGIAQGNGAAQGNRSFGTRGGGRGSLC